MTLCLSLLLRDPEETRRRMEAAQGLAGLVELRLDAAPDLDVEAFVRASPLPVIATCMRAADGGLWRGSEEERNARLRAAARGGARWVDLPLGAPDPGGLPSSTRILRSWHGRPGEAADLGEVLRRLEEGLRPGGAAKVVPWAEDPREAMAVLPLYGQARHPLVAFAMGPGGRASRAWSPVFGAPWVYTAWSPEEATAPGQWTLRELFSLYPPGGPGPRTQLFAVVGRPVGHSRSPLLWNTAFRILGLDAFYLAVEPADFEGFLAAHSHPAFRGFSVTAPFKGAALAAADRASEAARAVGAANTLRRGPHGWEAFATDGPAALDALAGAGLEGGSPVLILGAGGAARCAAFEAVRRGHPVTVAARRPEQARELAAALAPALGPEAQLAARDLAELRREDALADFGGVIQATPLGSRAAPGDPLEGAVFRPGQAVLDMVYDPPETALLRRARAAGARTAGGGRMLLLQMLEQFRLATGLEAPREPLERALEADLAAAAEGEA